MSWNLIKMLTDQKLMDRNKVIELLELNEIEDIHHMDAIDFEDFVDALSAELNDEESIDS